MEDNTVTVQILVPVPQEIISYCKQNKIGKRRAKKMYKAYLSFLEEETQHEVLDGFSQWFDEGRHEEYDI